MIKLDDESVYSSRVIYLFFFLWEKLKTLKTNDDVIFEFETSYTPSAKVWEEARRRMRLCVSLREAGLDAT